VLNFAYVVSLHWTFKQWKLLLICRAWRHVKWCRDWVKSCLGCRGEWRRTVPLIHLGRSCEKSASRLRRFTPGKGFQWIWRGPLVEVTSFCETADAHNLPHVLGWVATKYLLTWACVGVSFCPIWVAGPLMAAQSWCLQSNTWGTVTVAVMHWTWTVCCWL
jgi:hypothetical protein